jgi:hypothetical protein
VREKKKFQVRDVVIARVSGLVLLRLNKKQRRENWGNASQGEKRKKKKEKDHVATHMMLMTRQVLYCRSHLFFSSSLPCFLCLFLSSRTTFALATLLSGQDGR